MPIATSGSITPASSLSITGLTFAASSWAVLALGYRAVTPGVDRFVSLTDSVGNTWTSRLVATNAAADHYFRIFTCPQNVGPITALATITATFADADYQMLVVDEVAQALTFVAAGSGAAVYPATPSIALGSIPATNFIFGAGLLQQVQGDSGWTADAGWGSADIVGSLTNMLVIAQSKIVGTTGLQTYAPGFSPATPFGNWELGWVELTRDPPMADITANITQQEITSLPSVANDLHVEIVLISSLGGATPATFTSNLAVINGAIAMLNAGTVGTGCRVTNVGRVVSIAWAGAGGSGPVTVLLFGRR